MQYDIIIIGGGMVGASLACALLGKNLKIALVDSSPLDINNDQRLIALNDNSIRFFKNLGIWPSLVTHAEAIKQIHVSHQGRLGITRINSTDVNLTTLGYVVPARYINEALTKVLFDRPNIEILRPASLESLSQHEHDVQITIKTLSELKELRAKRLVGADGTHSTVRHLLNIGVETVDYQQSALVTVTELKRPHENIAYERFLKSGALAMLPLRGDKVATIWTDNNETIKQLLALPDNDFLALLQKEFGYRLGRLMKIGKRASYPLQMLVAKEHTKKHTTLVGNALHTMSPIAAQGLNLALYEVAVLADNFHSEAINIKPFNIQLSHRLTWLFSSDFFLLNTARQLGLISLDIFPFIKKNFVKHAMGNNGKMPLLLLRDSG